MIKIFRVLIVGMLFILFGLLCLFGNLIFIPIIIFRLYKLAFFRNLSRDMVCFSWRLFIYCSKIFGYLRYEYINFNALGKSGEILIANHPSLLDVVLILSRVRRINCVVKDSLRKNIFLFGAIKASGYIANSHNEILLDKSMEALKNGESLLIFPEGTRTKNEIIFHKASSYIAINAAKKLVPIFISMNPRSLKKGGKWYDTPKTTIKYTLEAKDSISLDEFLASKSNAIRTRELHNILSQMYKEEFKNARFD